MATELLFVNFLVFTSPMPVSSFIVDLPVISDHLWRVLYPMICAVHLAVSTNYHGSTSQGKDHRHLSSHFSTTTLLM